MDISTITSVALSVPPAVYVKYGVGGAVLGAILTPPLVFIAIKLNYRRLGDAYAGFTQTGAFYRLFAVAGAALFALIGGSQPLLEAAGGDEVYIRGAMIPVIMIIVGIPFVRALKQYHKDYRAGLR